jgi:hypothetical protein
MSKLVIKKVTLKDLDDANLDQVVGGQTGTCDATCVSSCFTCVSSCWGTCGWSCSSGCVCC